MRVLESMLLFAAASAEYDANADPTSDLEKIKERPKRDSYNRLVTIAKLINRHTISSKRGDPNQEPNYGLADKPKQVDRINKARAINNVFFNNNLKRMYFKEDRNGELKCAKHTKGSRRGGSRQRRSLVVTDDDWYNYCIMLELAHDDDEKTDEKTDRRRREQGEEGEQDEQLEQDECAKDEDGNFLYDHNLRGIKTMGDFDPNDPEDFVKKTRKLYTVLKKWVDTYLSECRGQNRRYTRVKNFLSNRLFNGITNGNDEDTPYTNMAAIEAGRWKRVFPKVPAGADPQDYEDLNKDAMIADLKDRVNSQ